MVNAWSLAWEVLNGTMDKNYPIINTNVGAGNTAENDGLDYEVDLYDGASSDYLADIDVQYAHHFMNYEPKRAHYYKYHEEEILKDIEEYVSGTYQGHYTGNSHEFRKVQTIDLMASKDLAAAFCQANIITVSYTHLTLPTIRSV